MSLDVYLLGPESDVEQHCDCCNRSYVERGREWLYDANITHNLNRMAEAAGIYKHLWRPDELGIDKARELIEPLTEGLRKLKEKPAVFKEYNPSNGWGNYDGLVHFVANYLAACERHPDADVRVSR